MCFTESQSFIHTIILIIGSTFIFPEYRLSATLIFLSLKELIQGLLYRNIRNKKSTKSLTILSWIHICFQPLFANIFFSHFHKDFKYWNIIFLICFLGGLYSMTYLEELDIQDDPNCHLISDDDYCSPETGSYLGKYHIGYQFNLDQGWEKIRYMYYLMLILGLFTDAKYVNMIWILSTILTLHIFKDTKRGEVAAIWCYLSILVILPIALLHKKIQKIIG